MVVRREGLQVIVDCDSEAEAADVEALLDEAMDEEEEEVAE